ncbi:uncharacterized protein [Henckelia pumila]|uniref:uncharacterized protein n=1 Tax=Henckelia pumila TaxID=405737 RepID=UPI003C6E5306
MPPRSAPITRQTVVVPQAEQENIPQPVVDPQNAQGSTSNDPMDVTGTLMEMLLKRFKSFKPPTLKGTENSLDCENWLEYIDQLFESLDYSDERRIRLVVHQLHEVAKVSYKKDKGAEFDILKQGHLNIEDYVTKFSSLLKFSPHIARNDEAMADQFINDLNPHVITLVNVGRPNNFSDALNRANGAECNKIRYRCNNHPSDLREEVVVVAERILVSGQEVSNSRSQEVVLPVPVGHDSLGLDRVLDIQEFIAADMEDFILLINVEECLAVVIYVTKSVTMPRCDLNVQQKEQPVQVHLDQNVEGFFVYAVDVLKSSPELTDIPVMREFADVFLDEIPRLSPVREIYFNIALMLGDGISVDPSNVEAVINWPRPTSVPEICSFMGLAGYYGRFIKDFSNIAKPITQLAQKNAPYVWTEACEASFLELKKRLTSAPVLTIPSELFVKIKEARKTDLNIQIQLEKLDADINQNTKSVMMVKAKRKKPGVLLHSLSIPKWK